MTARKEALERRISELQGEREGLSCDLDETEERILALERQNREQDNQVRKKIAFPTKTVFLTSFLFCRTKCRDRLAIVSLKIGSVFPSWPPTTFWKKKQRPARPPFPLSPSPEKQFRPLSPFPFDDGFWMDSPPRKNHETGGKKGGGLLAL